MAIDSISMSLQVVAMDNSPPKNQLFSETSTKIEQQKAKIQIEISIMKVYKHLIKEIFSNFTKSIELYVEAVGAHFEQKQ